MSPTQTDYVKAVSMEFKFLKKELMGGSRLKRVNSMYPPTVEGWVNTSNINFEFEIKVIGDGQNQICKLISHNIKGNFPKHVELNILKDTEPERAAIEFKRKFIKELQTVITNKN